MSIRNDDPRMIAPQCHSLQPVITIHENKWFFLVNRGGYYTMEYHQPQVVILPVVDNHSIVMVRVKRPVIADSALELPAGGAKENEEPLESAAREFIEETGIKIEQPIVFGYCPQLQFLPIDILFCLGYIRLIFRKKNLISVNHMMMK